MKRILLAAISTSWPYAFMLALYFEANTERPRRCPSSIVP
ncbi:uncharacterized protein FFB20_12486 [Fusarium fujikuroi]|uniref:Uncharacterized protein n=1 Tax=Fusarium proliferatum (strain ET1) TaxID=1227346 RepID=A0A1L7VKD6_FUSPR|nr:uncharacterized protein FPRO_10590 [Fusarium proliferatum ET1]SCN95867.1 uncharacterized protein FFE2_08342 [Fusarium fujikuroi]CZR41001.1 uncharacterized protein FPRO_10590 [Fusarium proliferatum ET1]SCO01777.1 uncharacterized protein FFM5_07668 [Fusarium fujikuroi]SCO06168.1 uncharacterized protein FFB20_12486 [Fusarium fujikuroi]SCO21220.1 uncharacterized protein FFC1_14054 [Fusarium fujikuroi]